MDCADTVSPRSSLQPGIKADPAAVALDEVADRPTIPSSFDGQQSPAASARGRRPSAADDAALASVGAAAPAPLPGPGGAPRLGVPAERGAAGGGEPPPPPPQPGGATQVAGAQEEADAQHGQKRKGGDTAEVGTGAAAAAVPKHKQPKKPKPRKKKTRLEARLGF